MTTDQEYLVISLKSKINTLIKLYETTKKENNNLVEEIRNLNETIEHKTKSYNELTTQYNSLKIAKDLSLDKYMAKEAKDKIDNLVREIDECIALISV